MIKYGTEQENFEEIMKTKDARESNNMRKQTFDKKNAILDQGSSFNST